MTNDLPEFDRLVADALLDADFKKMLHAQASTGEYPIIMARVEEKMSSIFARLRTNGGIGNVVYQWEGKLAVLSLQPVAVRPLDEPVQPVGMTAELGTLVAAMAETGSHHMIIRPKAPIDGQTLIESTRSMSPTS